MSITSLLLIIESFLLALLAINIPGLCPYDVPNHRSSHTRIIPRSGPILGLLFLLLLLPLDPFVRGSFLLLTLLGFIDDHLSIKPITKLVGQILFIMGIVYFSGISIWWTLPIIAFSNFTNFVDGINGLMLSQLLLVSVGMIFFSSFPSYYILVSCFIFGVFFLNFPKPFFFSGDCTSLSLPVILAVPVLLDSTEVLFIFLSLSSILWVDPTLTLFKRAKRRVNVLHAHREHAYQLLIQMRYSQTFVTLSAIVISLFILSAHLIGFEPLKILIVSTLCLGILWTLINWRFYSLNLELKGKN